MVKRKVTVTEDDELFVRKSKFVSTSTKKTIEIHQLIKDIEDKDNKMKGISTPKFKLAGVDCSIDVYPDSAASSGFIGVFLNNFGKEDQMTSIAVKEASGKEGSWEMDKIEAGQGRGFAKFLSHENYRQYAQVHGDVLKLDVVVTVHTKAKSDVWAR